jgi:hypothetical protein
MIPRKFRTGALTPGLFVCLDKVKNIFTWSNIHQCEDEAVCLRALRPLYNVVFHWSLEVRLLSPVLSLILGIQDESCSTGLHTLDVWAING